MSPMFESHSGESPRQLVVDLCRQFYFQGWCTGTGGGISVRDGDRIYIAPSERDLELAVEHLSEG